MKIQKIEIGLEGAADILFDKFYDHSEEPRPADQKFYLAQGNILVLPAANVRAFLFNEKGTSCASKFEGKKKKDYISVGRSHAVISPQLIPFKDEKGKPIAFTSFDNGKFYINLEGGTTKMSGGGIIKQEAKPRPVMKLPWFLDFEISLVENNLIDQAKLHNWFEAGGILIALGSYRPDHGRFTVKKWKVK